MNKSKNVVKLNNVGKLTEILINDVCHLAINNNDLKALQAWKMGRKAGRFCAELYFISDGVFWTMELEYDDKDLSKEIIDILKDFV